MIEDEDIAARRSCVAGPSKQLHQIARSGLLGRGLAVVRDVVAYLRLQSKLRDSTDEFRCLFKHFVSRGSDKRCLRLVFDSEQLLDLGPNWLTVGLDRVEQLARETGQVSLPFDDAAFDSVLCIGIGRVSRPEGLVAEIKRVVRHSGEVWVQTSLCEPYRPPAEPDATADYFRFTPEGLRVLLESFDEIFASVYLPTGTSLRAASFFYGLNPSSAPLQQAPHGVWDIDKSAANAR